MHENVAKSDTKQGFLFLTINYSSCYWYWNDDDYDIISTVMITTATTVIITVILQH